MFNGYLSSYTPLPTTAPASPSSQSSPCEPLKKPSLDALPRVIRLLRVLFSPSPERIRTLYTLLILLSLLYQIVVYYVGIAIPQFYVILADKKDQRAFWELVGRLLGLYIAISATRAGIHFVGGLFALRSRKRLTEVLQEAYVKRRMLYEVSMGPVDNPDQRISQDVDKLSEELRKVLQDIVIEPLLIVYYTYQTFLVSGWQGPVLIYVYVIFSFTLCRYLMKPLIPLVYGKGKSEGDFRFFHVRLRENAESVALLRGEEREQGLVNEALRTLLTWQRRIVTRETILKSGTTFVNYLGSIVCYGIIANRIFEGVYDDLPPAELSALISRNLFFSLYLTYTFNAITAYADKYADIAGYAARVGQLLEAVNADDVYESTSSISRIPDTRTPAYHIKIQDVTYTSSRTSGSPLCSKLRMTITPNSHLLIMGPSGIGKSSLIRVLAGLWRPTEGHIAYTNITERDVMFLPQTPYMVHINSLRDQIAYPDPADRISDHEVHELLRAVGLDRMASIPLSTSITTSLSPGERQRLIFARILYHAPRFIFIDEGTSNVDNHTESTLFRLVAERGITIIAVCHRIVAGLSARVLRIGEGGQWTIEDTAQPNEQ